MWIWPSGGHSWLSQTNLAKASSVLHPFEAHLVTGLESGVQAIGLW